MEYNDRGTGFYQTQRDRLRLTALVETGHHAGRTRVRYKGHNYVARLLFRDTFTTLVNAKMRHLIAFISLIYLASYLFWSGIWMIVMRYDPQCMGGSSGTYAYAYAFAIVTQMTVGYGNTTPGDCWTAVILVIIQILVAIIMEAVTLGVFFAKVSHPKFRGRSIYISDSCCIARRDGVLKLMFRLADVRSTQVTEARLKVFLYTWGEGRITAEGEAIPVRVEELDLNELDGQLLLPLTLEHTIDERSPLCGHTHDSLKALNAEIIVTFEGTTEVGNPFMARQSYLYTEVQWGAVFEDIILKPVADNISRTSFISFEQEAPSFKVNLSRFHRVRRQEGVPDLPQSEISKLVVSRSKRTVPYPLLGENTLAVSDSLCISQNSDGTLRLSVRVADTYPANIVEMTVSMHLYRWGAPDAQGNSHFVHKQLECGYEEGEDRLFLRLPVEVVHIVDDESPLRAWLNGPSELAKDADNEIVVQIIGYIHLRNQNIMRQRTYNIARHLKWGYKFDPMVKHPAKSSDNKPRVLWSHFHRTLPIEGMAGVSLTSLSDQESSKARLLKPLKIDKPAGNEELNNYTVMGSIQDLDRYAARIGSLSSPKAFPRRRSLRSRIPQFASGRVTSRRVERPGSAADVEQGHAPEAPLVAEPTAEEKRVQAMALLERYADETMDATTSLPHQAALHPALPTADNFRALTMKHSRSTLLLQSEGQGDVGEEGVQLHPDETKDWRESRRLDDLTFDDDDNS